jgi:hypothetical protein
LAETHIQPLLAIGDVAAGQAAVPHRREEPASYPADRDRQKTRPLAGPRRLPDSRLQSGYALLASRIRRHFLILILSAVLILFVAHHAFPPEITRYPCLPVIASDERDLIYPLSGEAYVTAPEIALASQMGAEIRILDGWLFPGLRAARSPSSW